jgi:hypothetical protein
MLWHGSSEGFKVGDTWLFLTFGWEDDTSHVRYTLDSLLIENDSIRGAVFHINDTFYNCFDSPNDTRQCKIRINESLERYVPNPNRIPCFPDLIREGSLRYHGQYQSTSMSAPEHYLINGELRQIPCYLFVFSKSIQSYLFDDDLGMIYGIQDWTLAAEDLRIQLIQFNDKAISFEKVQNVDTKVPIIKSKPGILSKSKPTMNSINFYNLQGRQINRTFQQSKISGLEIIQNKQDGKSSVYVNLSTP